MLTVLSKSQIASSAVLHAGIGVFHAACILLIVAAMASNVGNSGSGGNTLV